MSEPTLYEKVVARNARIRLAEERFRDDVDRAVEAMRRSEPDPKDAVIARLLDGYEPHPDRTKQGWWRPGSPERPEMSDAEAAIVRNAKASRSLTNNSDRT